MTIYRYCNVQAMSRHVILQNYLTHLHILQIWNYILRIWSNISSHPIFQFFKIKRIKKYSQWDVRKCTKHLSKIYYHYILHIRSFMNNKSLRNCSFFLNEFISSFFNKSKYTVSMSHVCALIRVFHKLATDITTVSRFPTRFFSLITFQDYVSFLYLSSWSFFIVAFHCRKIKKQNLFSQ